MNLSQYLKRRGATTSLAKKLRVTPQLVHEWKTGAKQVPDKRCLEIERVTEGQVTAEELRPEYRWNWIRQQQEASLSKKGNCDNTPA